MNRGKRAGDRMSGQEDRRPPSRRIADELRAAIMNGDLADGDRLPSERELAAEYATARNTAREAVGILQAEGLAVAQHGRGVFVRLRRPLMRLGRERYSPQARAETGLSPFRIEVERQGRTPRVECRSVTTVPSPPEVAERLRLDEGQLVVRRENWYFADDEPVQVGVTYIPAVLVVDSPLGREKKLGPGSIYQRFEDLGHPIARIREEVSARMPTPDEVKGLAMPPGVPVLDVLHTSVDDQGRPFEVTRFVMRSDLNGLDYEMPVDG
ncbi:GntR family transcriptional regulator [Micromonospora echinospora]|uniref:GntR family transcriptional regulator n=1 Tax=Micromonospora echinospora TaxID=1877 RepID=UPI00379D901F